MDKLISQQAAIEAVEFGITYAKAIDTKTGEVRELFKQSNAELRKAVERIKALPSAQPDMSDYCDRLWKLAYERGKAERKTGRWIPDNTDYYRTKFICSACGKSEEVSTTGFGYGTMWDYCPMCGAKMERGEQK